MDWIKIQQKVFKWWSKRWRFKRYYNCNWIIDQYYINNNSSRGSNKGLNDSSENIGFSNKANSPNEKKALLDKNDLNENRGLVLEDGPMGGYE